jgi:SAM-dependent methyltransferase
MRPHLLEVLRCPQTGQRLVLEKPEYRDGRIRSGWLVAEHGEYRYAVRNFIPRFVPESTYADNFGIQWNKFRRTQLDSVSGAPISHNRFYQFTEWAPQELRGKWVLDAGCGAGRFTEVALDAGAHVVAVDYSSACEACLENHAAHPEITVLQADIYKLPLAHKSMDFIYCLGVLQHTPDVKRAFFALLNCLAANGRIAVDVYPRLWRNYLWPKYWLRPLTKRLPPRLLFSALQRLVPVLLRASLLLGRVPLVGRKLRYAIPVANYEGVFPLSRSQLKEWAVLDTFDMLSPRYDQPQSASTLRRWLEEAGLKDVSVERIGFIVGRGRRAPNAVTPNTHQ